MGGVIISRELFIKALDGLRQQRLLDISNGEYLAGVFGIEEPVMYDNSILVGVVLDLLGDSFDRSDLEHWIFDCDFGSVWDIEGDVFREDSGVFWDRLVLESGKFGVESHGDDVDK